MIWDPAKQNRELLTWYQKLIALRKAFPVLRTGSCRTVWADNATNIFGFVRYGEQGQVLVLLNNAPRAEQIALAGISWPQAVPKGLKDLLTAETVALEKPLELKPYGVKILG